MEALYRPPPPRVVKQIKAHLLQAKEVDDDDTQGSEEGDDGKGIKKGKGGGGKKKTKTANTKAKETAEVTNVKGKQRERALSLSDEEGSLESFVYGDENDGEDGEQMTEVDILLCAPLWASRNPDMRQIYLLSLTFNDPKAIELCERLKQVWVRFFIVLSFSIIQILNASFRGPTGIV